MEPLNPTPNNAPVPQIPVPQAPEPLPPVVTPQEPVPSAPPVEPYVPAADPTPPPLNTLPAPTAIPPASPTYNPVPPAAPPVPPIYNSPVPPTPNFSDGSSPISALLSKVLIGLAFLSLAYGTFAALTTDPLAPSPDEQDRVGSSCTPIHIGHRYPQIGETETLFLKESTEDIFGSDAKGFEGIVRRMRQLDETNNTELVGYSIVTNSLPKEAGPYYLWIAEAKLGENYPSVCATVISSLTQLYDKGPWEVSFTVEVGSGSEDHVDDWSQFVITKAGFGGSALDARQFTSLQNVNVILSGNYAQNWPEEEIPSYAFD